MTYGTFGAMPHEQVRLRDGTSVSRDVYDQTVSSIDKFYTTDLDRCLTIPGHLNLRFALIF